MSCRELIGIASSYQELHLDAPVRICPKCHRKAPVNVHVDGKKGIIYLSCSKCDRPIQKVKVKGKKNGNTTRSNQGPKAKT